MFYLTRIRGLALVWASFMKGPHESGATSFLIAAVLVVADGPEKKEINLPGLRKELQRIWIL